MYTGSWIIPGRPEECPEIAINAYIQAERYGVFGLREKMNVAVTAWLDENWPNAASLQLIVNCCARVPATAALRNKLVEHWAHLISSPDGTGESKKALLNGIESVSTFTMDVMKIVQPRFAKASAETPPTNPKQYKCGNCAKVFAMDGVVNGNMWCVNCGLKRSASDWEKHLVK
ncbi:hypothetical protein BAUCODRAFT_123907 [Baudoinia panamericana UAMH 10762]|uniref:BTB domain-containing protein n=1 Tax=Baudoinia panamericana (strain UAMH 10762) TaxID=717646 RepID=M2MFQ5_BAUPA|nr:uncharacterized protein BAUCODRAFT_123907 [Baudoinia panamericana UAMH 10762]EMC95471.1 hypothetical protein BAUCODRAFT_123907 [Baudoinia panamericana UAMH 10762]